MRMKDSQLTRLGRTGQSPKTFNFCPTKYFSKFFKTLPFVFIQGPTVSPVFSKHDGKVAPDYYAIVICVPKKALYKSVQQLRAVSHLTDLAV